MLVLSRKPGEEIVIGQDVSIRVLAIHGGRVRVGITAPAAMPIRREELRPRVHSSKEEPHPNEAVP